MPRGRLIFPYAVDIARLDQVATAADPDGAGPLTLGYDPDFREPVLVPDSSRLGVSARKEATLVRIKAQIDPDSFLMLQAVANGNSPESRVTIVAHFRDLENAGLVEASTGMAVFKTGDRLDAIYSLSGVLVQKILNPPGLFLTEAKPTGWGLGSPRPNLLELTFSSRDQGLTG